MRVKFLETVKHAGTVYEQDDIRSVAPALGELVCSMGWAQDEDGDFATGERQIDRNVVIDPDTLKIKAAVKHG